jgi:hypothetical protein
MTEPRQSKADESALNSVTRPVQQVPQYDQPNQTNTILVWVGIAAGVVFIVAVVFFSGFYIGRDSSGPSMIYTDGPWALGQQTPTTTAPTSPRP